MTLKIIWLLADKSTIPDNDPLKRCRLKSVYYFVGLELIGFAATFAITQTIGKPHILVLTCSGHWIPYHNTHPNSRQNVYLSSVLHSRRAFRT
jgi:hypothetical protein